MLTDAKTDNLLVINLPFFPGFYCSNLSQTIDNAEEMAGEHSAEKEESKEYYPETYQPAELRIDARPSLHPRTAGRCHTGQHTR